MLERKIDDIQMVVSERVDIKRSLDDTRGERITWLYN